MTQGELDAAISSHHEYLRTEGASGAMLDLESEDVSGLSFDGACLIGATLTLCNCSGATFNGTNFAEGIISGCDLSYSSWLGANAAAADFTSCNTTLWTAPDLGGPAT
jgi:uncharacterized protein YjbI with pentapeptide repeats